MDHPTADPTQPDQASQQDSKITPSPEAEAEALPGANPLSPTKATKQLQEHPSEPSPPSARHHKLYTSNQRLKTTITATHARLSTAIGQITQLKSFPSTSPGETSPNFSSDIDKAALSHAQTIITTHITQLKRYNEIKDVAMGMLGLIAEKEGKRIAEVMAEREISEKD